MSEHKKVKLSDLKEHISCFLCKGYLIEATTIIECLHTFCKNCIVKYLSDSNNTCPKCDNVIHQSHPLQYISFDRTMQDIVYKLVPNLERPKDSDSNNNIGGSIHSSDIKAKDGGNKLKPIDTNGQQKQNKASTPHDFHREDEQINLYVIPHSSCDLKPLKNKYIRLSSLATVTLLKKYIATKLFNDPERYKELDLLCNDNLLGKDHNFKFISVTEWREKVPPVKITYKPRSDD
uniref:Polycomb group RING finger protein 3 n=2 Tax=Aceria tosichella TaxID=561515 RepID=A0A6G1S3Q7_9ACAR